MQLLQCCVLAVWRIWVVHTTKGCLALLVTKHGSLNGGGVGGVGGISTYPLWFWWNKNGSTRGLQL